MALVKIPVSFSSPDFTMEVDLDGDIFGFRFTLNERTGRWSMSISDEAGTLLVAGIAVVTNWKLIERFKDERLPKGKLFTCDVTGGNAEPDEVSFGQTILLCYDEATT